MSPTSLAKRRIREVFEDFRTKGYSSQPPFPIGSVGRRLSNLAKKLNIELASGEIYFDVGRIGHSIRDSKQRKGMALSEEEIINFPTKRHKMELYFDTTTEKFTYVGKYVKFIVHPHQNMPGKGLHRAVAFVTAQTLNKDEKFVEGKRYIKA